MQSQAQATERAWNTTSTANAVIATGTASAVAQQAIWTQRAMILEISERKKGQVLVRQGKGNRERVVPLNADAREAVNE